MNLVEQAREAYAIYRADQDRMWRERLEAERREDEERLRHTLIRIGIERPTILIETELNGSYKMRANVDGVRFTLEKIEDSLKEVYATVTCPKGDGCRAAYSHMIPIEGRDTAESFLVSLGSLLAGPCFEEAR